MSCREFIRPNLFALILFFRNDSARERRHPWRPPALAARDGGVPGGKTYA